MAFSNKQAICNSFISHITATNWGNHKSWLDLWQTTDNSSFSETACQRTQIIFLRNTSPAALLLSLAFSQLLARFVATQLWHTLGEMLKNARFWYDSVWYMVATDQLKNKKPHIPVHAVTASVLGTVHRSTPMHTHFHSASWMIDKVDKVVLARDCYIV